MPLRCPKTSASKTITRYRERKRGAQVFVGSSKSPQVHTMHACGWGDFMRSLRKLQLVEEPPHQRTYFAWQIGSWNSPLFPILWIRTLSFGNSASRLSANQSNYEYSQLHEHCHEQPTSDHHHLVGSVSLKLWWVSGLSCARKKGKRVQRERESFSEGSEIPPLGWVTFPSWYCDTVHHDCFSHHRSRISAKLRYNTSSAADHGKAASPVTSDGLSGLLVLLRPLRFAWNVFETKETGQTNVYKTNHATTMLYLSLTGCVIYVSYR